MSLAFSIASSSSSNGATATNGTNSSFFQIQLSAGTSTIVGSTNKPRAKSPSVSRLPPVTIVPFLRASSAASSNVSIAGSLMIGPEVDVALDRVPDLDLLGLLLQQTQEVVVDLALHEHARAGGALLPAEPERRTQHAVGRLVQVGALRDDRGVLPAHLADDRLRDLVREVLVDVHAHRVRTGERDAAHVGVLPEMVAGVRTAAGHQVERAGRHAAVAVALVELVAHQRALVRRLQDHGVAGDERTGRRSARERHREVERADDRPHPVRTQDVVVVARPRPCRSWACGTPRACPSRRRSSGSARRSPGRRRAPPGGSSRPRRPSARPGRTAGPP